MDCGSGLYGLNQVYGLNHPNFNHFYFEVQDQNYNIKYNIFYKL